MTLEEEFRLLVSGYYGVLEMDDYKLKEYVLKSIEEYIIMFVSNKEEFINYNYEESISYIKDKVSLKTKLQDSLLVLRKVNGPLDLILMIKERISQIN